MLLFLFGIQVTEEYYFYLVKIKEMRLQLSLQAAGAGGWVQFTLSYLSCLIVSGCACAVCLQPSDRLDRNS